MYTYIETRPNWIRTIKTDELPIKIYDDIFEFSGDVIVQDPYSGLRYIETDYWANHHNLWIVKEQYNE